MLRRLWSQEEGVVAPMAALLMVVLVGFAALALDFGTIYANRRALQNAADAAALAGAKDLENVVMGGTGSPATQALVWANKNGVPPPPAPATAGATCTADGKPSVTYNGRNAARGQYSWEVTTSKLVPLTFGPIIGLSQMCVSADAVAVITTGAEAKLFPYAINDNTTLPLTASPGTNQSCDPNNVPNNQYCFVLKEGAGGSTSGNFGILDFTCAGSQAKTSKYVNWVENGYGSAPGETIPITVSPASPWQVCTFTGNTSSGNSTIDNWIQSTLAAPPPTCPQGFISPNYTPDFRCPLIGLLPVLDHTYQNGTGSSGTVHIINFLVFEIVGLYQDQNGTGHQQIVGEFLQFAKAVGPTRLPDPNGQLSGALMIRLIQ
jgi:Flp pilus assembly protein TadG